LKSYKTDKELEPGIKILPEKKFVGKRKKMSLADNKTRELWQGFMPRRKEIKNNMGSELYSIERYEPLYFRNFNPHKEFEKWAAVEVTDFNSVPDDLGTLIIPSGLYAVFLYRGAASKGSDMYQYIFGTWLPDSGFKLDNRPHFAVMGEKYKNEDPDSEEEIWIPIKMH
jgi:AraC family transcriptional regulator